MNFRSNILHSRRFILASLQGLLTAIKKYCPGWINGWMDVKVVLWITVNGTIKDGSSCVRMAFDLQISLMPQWPTCKKMLQAKIHVTSFSSTSYCSNLSWSQNRIGIRPPVYCMSMLHHTSVFFTCLLSSYAILILRYLLINLLFTSRSLYIIIYQPNINLIKLEAV